jgi:Na+-driven multidrug efflux pump
MTLIIMPIIGINQGSLPIIGYNYGAKKYDRVQGVLKYAIMASTALSTLGFLVTHLFPSQLMSFFSPDKELIAFGSKLMFYFLLMLPVIGFQAIGAGFFQAIRKAGKSMILNISRQVLILIPALLILPYFFKMNGVFAAGPISDLMAAVLTAYWLTKEIKKLGISSKEEMVVNTSLAKAE